MQIDGDGVDLVGLSVLALLVNIAAALWAAGVAMRLRTIQAGPLMQIPVFLILFMAPVYVPLSLLNGWIQRRRLAQPDHAPARGRAAASSPATRPWSLAFALGITLPVLFALWASGGLRSAEAAG